MKTLAILQARMGSSRLPGKTLADVHGKPMLQWLLDRIKAVPQIAEIVVATTTDPSDDGLAAWLATVPGVACFRGSVEDVLDRFYQASRGHDADVIVRLTGDDPLKDPGLVGRTIDALRANPDVDYASTFLKPSEREHVTPYVWKNPQLFRLHSVEQARDLSGWRWTVDKPADLEFVRAVYAHFKDRPLVSYDELAAFIEAHPELSNINAGTVRHEGYLKSLTKDQK